MTDIFTYLRHNISLCNLNLSTVEGKNRNSIGKSGIVAMKSFFSDHKTLVVANFSSMGLKD